MKKKVLIGISAAVGVLILILVVCSIGICMLLKQGNSYALDSIRYKVSGLQDEYSFGSVVINDKLGLNVVEIKTIDKDDDFIQAREGYKFIGVKMSLRNVTDKEIVIKNNYFAVEGTDSNLYSYSEDGTVLGSEPIVNVKLPAHSIMVGVFVVEMPVDVNAKKLVLGEDLMGKDVKINLVKKPS